MKILYLVHQFYPMHYTGTEKFLLNLMTTMQKWGHKVKVVTYSFYEDSFYDSRFDGFVYKEFLYKSLPIVAFKQQRPPIDLEWGIANPALAAFANSIFDKEKFDLVHVAHGMRLGEFALAAKQRNIPYLTTLTDFFLMCPKCKLFTSKGTLCTGPEKGEECKKFCPEFPNDAVKKRLALAEQILRGAECVAAPSKFLGSLFKGEFPWLEPKVIPYGIDYSRIKRNTKTYSEKDKLVLLYAGQIDYHKGVHVLIDAVKRIKADNFVVKLYGSGPPTVEHQMKEMAKEDARIQFCGVYMEDRIGDVFSKADVVVVPSLWHENNTIVVREALASHLPVIVSNAGGIVEIIQEGKNGFICRMGDVNHLKETIERVVNRPELLAAMKKNLNHYAVTTVEQEAYAYLQEYQRITGKNCFS
jgi:glycosyltransferase involved in cell wall biosynthesis